MNVSQCQFFAEGLTISLLGSVRGVWRGIFCREESAFTRRWDWIRLVNTIQMGTVTNAPKGSTGGTTYVRRSTGCVWSSTMKGHSVPNATTPCRSGPIA